MVSANSALRIGPRQGSPQLGLRLRIGRRGKDRFRRYDAHYVVALVVERDVAANDVWIGSEMCLPKRLTKHRNMPASTLIFLRQKNAAQDRLHLEYREELRRHPDRGH